LGGLEDVWSGLRRSSGFLGDLEDIGSGSGHPHKLVASPGGIWKSFRGPDGLLEGVWHFWVSWRL